MKFDGHISIQTNRGNNKKGKCAHVSYRSRRTTMNSGELLLYTIG